MNISQVEFDETCFCPRCGELTHPEYLAFVTKTGEVVACAMCAHTLFPTKGPGARPVPVKPA